MQLIHVKTAIESHGGQLHFFGQPDVENLSVTATLRNGTNLTGPITLVDTHQPAHHSAADDALLNVGGQFVATVEIISLTVSGVQQAWKPPMEPFRSDYVDRFLGRPHVGPRPYTDEAEPDEPVPAPKSDASQLSGPEPI